MSHKINALASRAGGQYPVWAIEFSSHWIDSTLRTVLGASLTIESGEEIELDKHSCKCAAVIPEANRYPHARIKTSLVTVVRMLADLSIIIVGLAILTTIFDRRRRVWK